MRFAPVLAVLLVAGCSHPQRVPPGPLGVRQHLGEADRHDADAARLEESAASLETAGRPTPATCGDQTLADQTTSGGVRIGAQAPCWSGERGAVAREREAATHLRADARAHRARARALVVAADSACAGIPEDEIDHSPFDHHEDIAGVEAELQNDRVVGARIRFAAVTGLDADWLERALTCHQALAAAVGYDPMFFSACPAVLPGSHVHVIENAEGLTAVIVSDDPAAALTIYARAEALLAVTPEE